MFCVAHIPWLGDTINSNPYHWYKLTCTKEQSLAFYTYLEVVLLAKREQGVRECTSTWQSKFTTLLAQAGQKFRMCAHSSAAELTTQQRQNVVTDMTLRYSEYATCCRWLRLARPVIQQVPSRWAVTWSVTTEGCQLTKLTPILPCVYFQSSPITNQHTYPIFSHSITSSRIWKPYIAEFTSDNMNLWKLLSLSVLVLVAYLTTAHAMSLHGEATGKVTQDVMSPVEHISIRSQAGEFT